MNTAENFIDEIRWHLDESVEAIHPVIATRISAARATAILEGTNGRIRWFWSAVSLAVIAPVCFAVMVWIHQGQLKPTQEQLTAMEIISSEKDFEICKDMEFYDNLEFYTWLANTKGTKGWLGTAEPKLGGEIGSAGIQRSSKIIKDPLAGCTAGLSSSMMLFGKNFRELL